MPAKRWWKSIQLGPGLVFVLAAVGPQDLIVNSTAGAGYGYALLWTVLLVVIARFVLLEATARFVVVTGKTLMSGYAEAGNWTTRLILFAIVVKRHLNGLSQLLLLGSSLHLIAPLPMRWSLVFWSLLSWILGFSMMYWGKYKFIERFSKPMAVILGGTLLLIAVAARPDLTQVAKGIFIPSIPDGYGYSPALVILALIGAGSGSLGNLKYAAFVHEKGWNSLAFLRKQRIDLCIGGLSLFFMLAMMQIAAAGVLYPSTIKLREIEDLLPMFTSALGFAGRFVLGICVWSAVFTTYLGSCTGDCLLVSDIYYNNLRRPAGGKTIGNHSSTQAYRWTLAFACLSPLYVFFTSLEPLFLVLLSSAVVALLLPVMTGVLLWLTTRKDTMGTHVNGPVATAMMVCISLATFYLAYQNALELWAKL
jgi:Mn2+/Fe2+ NRAMP family transporter